MKALGHVDILVNNAGAAWGAPAEDHPIDAWDKVMNLNVRGYFILSQYIGKHSMIPRRSGTIINIASITGLGGNPTGINTIAYNTSKGAVVNLTRSLAVEWAREGIRVNAIAPTWVRTDFIESLTAQPELMARIEAMTPMGRIAEVDEIVGGVIYLASPAAGMVTGHTLAIDGGFLAQ